MPQVFSAAAYQSDRAAHKGKGADDLCRGCATGLARRAPVRSRLCGPSRLRWHRDPPHTNEAVRVPTRVTATGSNSRGISFRGLGGTGPGAPE